LSNICSHGQRVHHAAVDPADRQRPAAADDVDGGEQRRQPVHPGLLHHRPSDRVREQPDEGLGGLGASGSVSLHADGVDDRVWAPPAGPLPKLLRQVIMVFEADDLDAVAAGHLEPLGHQVHTEDLGGADVAGDTGAHLADRTEPQHGDAAPGGNIGVGHRLPGGGQHVREEQKALVRRPLGYLDRAVLGLGDPQELGLAPGHLAVQLGVAEQRATRAVLAHLSPSRTAIAGRCRTSSSGRTRC
jgi:hypothetical protein